MVTFNDIKVFESQKGKGRGSNDKNNNLREEILLLLVSLPPNLNHLFYDYSLKMVH